MTETGLRLAERIGDVAADVVARDPDVASHTIEVSAGGIRAVLYVYIDPLHSIEERLAKAEATVAEAERRMSGWSPTPREGVSE